MSSKSVPQPQLYQLFFKRLSIVLGFSGGMLLIAGALSPWVETSAQSLEPLEIPIGIEHGGLPVLYLGLGAMTLILAISFYLAKGKDSLVFLSLLCLLGIGAAIGMGWEFHRVDDATEAASSPIVSAFMERLSLERLALEQGKTWPPVYSRGVGLYVTTIGAGLIMTPGILATLWWIISPLIRREESIE